MPRKLRRPKGRTVFAANVHPGMFSYLLWGDISAAADLYTSDGASPFELFVGDHAGAWRVIESRALREWVRYYPGTRPESWWLWSAPELRRVLVDPPPAPVVGARDRCHGTGLPYGGWWRLPDVEVESQAACLDRLQLWLPRERARVPAAAFEPERAPNRPWDQPYGIPTGWRVPADASSRRRTT